MLNRMNTSILWKLNIAWKGAELLKKRLKSHHHSSTKTSQGRNWKYYGLAQREEEYRNDDFSTFPQFFTSLFSRSPPPPKKCGRRKRKRAVRSFWIICQSLVWMDPAGVNQYIRTSEEACVRETSASQRNSLSFPLSSFPFFLFPSFPLLFSFFSLSLRQTLSYSCALSTLPLS